MKKKEKDEIIDLIQKELKDFVKDELDKEMADILHKSNSKTHKELIDMIKDSLESVFKLLWVKKDFWKTNIK